MSGLSVRSPTTSGADAARRAPAQQRAQAREQLLALEGLDEVVVGAGVEALDARLDRVAGGEHEDRDVPALAQALGHVDAVEAGESEVEDHQVGGEDVRLVERRHAVAGDARLVALQPQRALENLGDVLVVLDDQDARRACVVVHVTDGTTTPALAGRFLPGAYRVAGAFPRLSKSMGRMATRRKPPARKRKTARRPARKASLADRMRMPVLDQHHLELIGLGLVAAGIFFSFVFYFDWDGGKVGEAIADGGDLLPRPRRLPHAGRHARRRAR